MELPYRKDNLTGMPLEHYAELFRAAEVSEIEARLGLHAENGVFRLTVLGEEKTVTYPDFADEGWDDRRRILFLRYLLEGKKTGAATGFVPYRALPWGSVYEAKFSQRCLARLAGTYGNNIALYREKCTALGAKKLSGSGDGYEFAFLPGLSVRFIVWEGDEDFPASAQILFSDNFPQAFSAEDCVVVCECILGAMKRA